MNNLISIIVPVYNVSLYLNKCIQSVINQTYKDLQIILVDDGSTDGSSQICDNYARIDSRIEVIHKPNGGLVSARKAGIQIATGDYVGYVDGDDWIEADCYEELFQIMQKENVDLVDFDYHIEFGEKSKVIKNKLSYGLYDSKDIISIMLCDKDFNECMLKPYLCLKLFKRDILFDIQMSVDETIRCGEDIAVTYPYILKSKNIFISEYAGYHYLQRPSSMTSIISNDEILHNKALINYLKNIFQKSKYENIMMNQLNQYTKSMLLLRKIDYFDVYTDDLLLSPFGGLKKDCKIVLYGAGKLGQSIYRYVNNKGGVTILDWLDREYYLYQEIGLHVNPSDKIKELIGQFDKVIIAVSSRHIAVSIKCWLYQQGVDEKAISWLKEDFIEESNNILNLLCK